MEGICPELSYDENDNPVILFDGIKIDRFRLLAFASQTKREEDAWMWLNLASRMYHGLDDPTFNALYGVVAMSITRESFTQSENNLASSYLLTDVESAIYATFSSAKGNTAWIDLNKNYTNQINNHFNCIIS